jgi:hypothetical protein
MVRTYKPKYDNFKSYKIILTPEPCGSEVEFILGIKSLHGNLERRHQIRKSWGKEKYYKEFPAKMVFLFGNSNVKELEQENGAFGDVLAGDFIESFHNLTFKDGMLLTWAKNNCKVRFLFKGKAKNIVRHTNK